MTMMKRAVGATDCGGDGACSSMVLLVAAGVTVGAATDSGSGGGIFIGDSPGVRGGGGGCFGGSERTGDDLVLRTNCLCYCRPLSLMMSLLHMMT
eukprot:CAMPEP_0119329248 /NCGR_PEP_ID=MMETSP1333-20130426/75423_1 /TAXON_ID=418940 /ORGANISM="Scyphosphaera apsteinii, Strain RCC1455" /LENGTH=94 /DNA_ID=CAMNT_0007338321 /DNA_START=179 /DNA_END=459 /DNA_ORIENTATION=+